MNWFFFALFSAFAVTIGNLLTKVVLKKAHSLQVAGAASITSLLIGLVFIPYVDFSLEPKTILLILLSSLIASISYIYSVKAYRHMDVSVVSPLFNVGTLITIFFAIIIFQEQITLVQFSGSLFLVFGAYLINFKGKDLLYPFKELLRSNDYHHLVISIVGYSVLAIFIKYILNIIDPITYLFFELFFRTIIISSYIFIRHNGVKDIRQGFAASGWLILIIGITSVADYYFWFMATSKGDVSLVVPVLRLWTLFTVILGGFIFQEKKTNFRLISCLIMLIGVFIITF